MIETVAGNLLIALLLGAAIGLERQSSRQSDFESDFDEAIDPGIRTFSLIGLLGCLSAVLYVNQLPIVFVLSSSAFVILLCAHYILSSITTKHFGFTTELSLVLTFLIGVCAGTNVIPLQITVATAVVVIVVLSLKGRSEMLVSEVNRSERESFISYAIVALVILPFLTDTTYTLGDLPVVSSIFKGLNIDFKRFENLELLNPQNLWFIVVLITGIDIVGYIMSKFVGKERGFALTSFAGGFVSSTLTTISLAQKSAQIGAKQSKDTANINYLVGAAVLANQASFFQIMLLVGPLNSNWLIAILPTLSIMVITSTLLAIYFLKWKGNKQELNENGKDVSTEEAKIFSIVSAMKFALLLLSVKVITNFCLIIFGKTGFIISSIIASFAGIDAILINLAGMAGGSLTFEFALFTFILVNATNLLAKCIYCYLQGSKSFTLNFLLSCIVIVTTSFLGFLFV